jgi:hypothetical protein
VDVREALNALDKGTPKDAAVQLAYVNPETGAPCLPTLGFSAQMLRNGLDFSPRPRSASSVMHIIEGRGESEIDGVTLKWSEVIRWQSQRTRKLNTAPATAMPTCSMWMMRPPNALWAFTKNFEKPSKYKRWRTSTARPLSLLQ